MTFQTIRQRRISPISLVVQVKDHNRCGHMEYQVSDNDFVRAIQHMRLLWQFYGVWKNGKVERESPAIDGIHPGSSGYWLGNFWMVG